LGAEVSPLRHWIGGPAGHFAEASRAKAPTRSRGEDYANACAYHPPFAAKKQNWL